MKRTLALLLAALMLLGLMACASQPAAPTEPSAPADTPATSEPAETPADAPADEPADAPADEPADEPVDAPAEEPEVELTTDAFEATEETELPKGFAEGSEFPICAPGEITIEVWKSAGDKTLQAAGEPYGENYAYAKIEEETGISVNWNLFSSANYSTQLSLMFASEEYPDFANVIGFNYNGGWERAVEDDVVVDLAQHEDIMPNYMRWVNRTMGNRKNAYTDSGMMPTFAQIYNRTQSAWMGYLIRQNWLDDLGLAMPTTLQEWDTVLRAFKEEKTGGAAPLDVGSSGRHLMNFIEGAFNFNGTAYYGLIDVCGIICVDDVLHSSFRDQGMYDYLELMSGWYADGLIDPDFPSLMFGWSADRMANNESGIVPGMYTQAGDFAAKAGMAEEGTYLSLLPMPTTEGYDRKIYHNGKYSSGLSPNGGIVFAASEYVEETIRWIDYRYSEAGYMLSNYGIEGTTFNYDENGNPKLVDLIADNPDGMSIGDAMGHYLIHNGCVVFLLEREESQVNDEGKKYNDLWGNRGEWNASGNLTLNSEEGEERGMLVTDINTYVSEFVVKVIMGQIELNDQTWGEFQDQLTVMKLDRVVEITQQAYDRYLQR